MAKVLYCKDKARTGLLSLLCHEYSHQHPPTFIKKAVTLITAIRSLFVASPQSATWSGNLEEHAKLKLNC